MQLYDKKHFFFLNKIKFASNFKFNFATKSRSLGQICDKKQIFKWPLR